MKRVLIAVLGIVGLVWFFQGINVFPGSFMTGDIRWAIAGIVAFAIALFMWRSDT